MGKRLLPCFRSKRSHTNRRLTPHHNSLDRTGAVTKCEHLKTPTPCVVMIVMTVMCIGYVNCIKSEATHCRQYNGWPYFPARHGQCFGRTHFQTLPAEETRSVPQMRMMMIMMMKMWACVSAERGKYAFVVRQFLKEQFNFLGKVSNVCTIIRELCYFA